MFACAKHFAGYSETQGGRDASEADLSHRKLESWFLPPFERIAKEGCGTFMLGYESIEGVPVTFNKWLLTDKLRGAWKYNGTLITDWDNVGRSVWEQKVKPDYVHAAADAVKAGNDLVMTTPGVLTTAPSRPCTPVCSTSRSSTRLSRASLRSSSASACSRTRVCRTRSASRPSSAPRITAA